MTSRSPRILIVDDSAEDREAYRRLILSGGIGDFIIEEADCGEAGLERCGVDPPDCVLLDYGLPDIDGLEFVDALRAEPTTATIPVVFLTGHGNEAVAVEAIKRGAQDYIVKSAAGTDSMRLALRGAIDRSVLRQMIERQSAVLDQRMAELREREGLFQLCIEHAPAAMTMLDREMNHIAASDLWLKVYGPEGEDIRGRNHYDVYPEIPERWKEVHCRCLAGAVEHADEDEFIRADGRSQWVRWEVRPWRRADGEIGGLIIFSEDITERKRSEAALRLSEERFKLSMDATSDGLWDWDATTDKVYFSPSWYRILGHEPGDFPATLESWKVRIHPDDFERTLAVNMDCVEGRSATFSVEYRLRARDGGWRWILGRGMAITRDASGRAMRLIGTHVDITGRKLAEERLREATEKLREADRRKDDFIAMLGHELRNPLAPIRNMAAVLRRSRGDDPRIASACEIIERQISQMTRLVDDLLDVSRMARGGFTVAREPCDLTGLVRQVVEGQRPQMEKLQLRLDLHLPDHRLIASADPHRLAQAVQNLLHNARKFTPAGGRVSVTLTADADCAEIAVRDSGVGVPNDLLPDIFEPFRQGPQTIDRPCAGLGLGLALVDGVLRLHDGEVIAANNEDGPGAAFRLRLPLAPSENAVPATSPFSGKARRVLIVEDNPLVAESTRMLVEVLGHEAQVARDGAEAVELARNFGPDLILCDIGLPAPMDGYAVARAIRREPIFDSTRLVAVSGYGHQEAVDRSGEAGFDLHLTKPIQEERLEELLAEA